ncbi:MAG: thermonuclease family protein [Candidatus Izemoplasmataceae bacterium]
MKHLTVLMLFTVSLLLIACEEDTSGYESNTPLTDQTLLQEDYEGKSFLEDDIGVVTLSRCVDGDTARFSEDDGETDFSVRFLGIDTPEIGRNKEPWGEAASEFTCNRLSNAFTIVLERDPASSDRETYGRYLAFVWVDGRLLNLELIEESYTHAVGVLSYKYGEVMQNAWYNAMEKNLRIHGEDDPDYS